MFFLFSSLITLAQDPRNGTIFFTTGQINLISGEKSYSLPSGVFTDDNDEISNSLVSVSDEYSHPLLLSDGTNVWTTNGSVNNYQQLTSPQYGNQLLGGFNNDAFLQNTIMIPNPDCYPNSYYFITIGGNQLNGDTSIGANRGLNYSEINIDGYITLLNTPLGIPYLGYYGSNGNKSNAITSTVNSDGHNYWLVASLDFGNGDTFLCSYLVTGNGIEHVYYLPTPNNGEATSIKISKNEIAPGIRRIACSGLEGNTFLGTFNCETGEIQQSTIPSNTSIPQAYSLEFSPNGNWLYCLNSTGEIYNIEISDTQITVPETPFTSDPQFKSLQLTPKNEIFISGNSHNIYSMGNLENPNYYPEAIFWNFHYNRAAIAQPVCFHDTKQMIPYFDPIVPYSVCKGADMNPLPTTSLNGITGTWSPALNNTATTTYTFTPIPGQDAANEYKTIRINELTVPLFNEVAPICSGDNLSPLPTRSNNYVYGSWSPAVNNTATTTYTFTPTAGQCAPVTTMTIVVNPKATPAFSAIGPICAGSTLTLPTTSTNGITGSWSPAVNNMATTNYTFTPTAGLCANTTTMTVTVNQKTTPTFNAIVPICAGSTLTLPTTSTNGIVGSWSPVVNNMATTNYTFTPTAGLCANTTTMTVTVNQKTNPTFNAIVPICAGGTLTLPTTSTNGIAGNWSPAVNNMATTAYTFTPTAGLCANTNTMTVTVKTTPVFNEIGMINNGAINYTLPTTSANGIVGTWNPSAVSEGERVHTYTPNTGECPITKSFLLMKQTTIDATDDDFSYFPIEEGDFNQDGDYYTSSVFDNDSIIFENIVSDYNASVSILSVTPPNYGDPFMMMPDGRIKIHRGTPYGTYAVVYKITQNNCSGKYDTATATVYIPDPNANSRKATKTQQFSDNISVYPNPSKDIFNFDLTNVKGDYDTVTVYNMLGAKIYENSLRGNSFNLIDLSDLATGFYIAKVSGKSGIASFQLIKQ